MKKLLYMLLAVLLLVGCTSENGHSTDQHEGVVTYIETLENGRVRMLVISDVTSQQYMNKPLEQLMNLATEMDSGWYYFPQEAHEELHVGTHVMIDWDGTQQDSNPPLRTAEQITVI